MVTYIDILIELLGLIFIFSIFRYLVNIKNMLVKTMEKQEKIQENSFEFVLLRSTLLNVIKNNTGIVVKVNNELFVVFTVNELGIKRIKFSRLNDKMNVVEGQILNVNHQEIENLQKYLH